MKKLTYKLRRFCKLPMGIISDNKRPYLERYYIGTFMNRRMYIHRFGSDPMRGWHNYPWFSAMSVVLWGEYGERCKPNAKTYAHCGQHGLAKLHISVQRVRWYNTLRERTAHVVGDWTPGVGNKFTRSPECWTLFVHPTEYKKPWGFWRNFAASKLGHMHSWHLFAGDKGKTSGVPPDTAPLCSYPNRFQVAHL